MVLIKSPTRLVLKINKQSAHTQRRQFGSYLSAAGKYLVARECVVEDAV